MTGNTLQDEFHILTTIGLSPYFDPRSIGGALRSNLKNNSVNRVHVLTESDLVAVKDAIPTLADDRVTVVPWERRPTIKDLFEYANGLASVQQVVVAVMNADISFDGDRDIAGCMATLNSCRRVGHTAVLCIARRDCQDGRFALSLRDHVGLPNFYSSDCWVFRPPLNFSDADSFYLGQMNCDLYLCFGLAERGYLLVNPCLDVSVLHHEREMKGLEFYTEKNEQHSSQEMADWQFLKNCNIPYKSFGVVWTRQSWVERGYLPGALLIERRRIYLLVNELLREPAEQCALYLTEIIAQCSGVDLLVLGEQVSNFDAELIGRVGRRSRSVYFVQVDSVADVVKNLIGGLQGCESIAMISKLSLLTPQLLGEFHSVILDVRLTNTIQQVNIPTGYLHLKGIASSRYGMEEGIPFDWQREDAPNSCTLLTSVFQADTYIRGFKDNITALHGYDDCVHVVLFSQLSEYESGVLLEWHGGHTNLVLGSYKKDPGLYECWNIGIRIARSEYLSNANVDDLRHPEQLEALLGDLRSRPEVAVAATAMIAFEKYVGRWEEIDASRPWYVDDAGEFGMEKLGRLERTSGGDWTLCPHNLPHCMPVWRRSMHEDYGYFDEERFGTFADWAFWLKVTKSGRKGFLNARPLSYYFINLSSHNRRGDQLNRFHAEVERDFLAEFYFKRAVSKQVSLPSADSAISRPLTITSGSTPRKLYLTGLTHSFGEHRNSFNRLIESLTPLHNESGGVRFIPFIERYFAWGNDDGEAKSPSPRPIQEPWIGMLHVPFDSPPWFEPTVMPENIFRTRLWQASLPHCRGIICLSEDLRRDVEYWYPDVPNFATKFPTVLDARRFDFRAYRARPRIVQAGDWLRRLQAIYEVSAPGHEKVMLMKAYTAEFLRREIAAVGDHRNDTVYACGMVDAKEYDNLLGSSVVLCLLYATAANNIVTECLTRRTPMLINPLPSVLEYLGDEYPLYVRSIEDASRAVADENRVKAAHDYLEDQDLLREALSYEHFANAIRDSRLYADL